MGTDPQIHKKNVGQTENLRSEIGSRTKRFFNDIYKIRISNLRPLISDF